MAKTKIKKTVSKGIEDLVNSISSDLIFCPEPTYAFNVGDRSLSGKCVRLQKIKLSGIL